MTVDANDTPAGDTGVSWPERPARLSDKTGRADAAPDFNNFLNPPVRRRTPVPTPVTGVDELYQRRVRGEIVRITAKLGARAPDSGDRHTQLMNTSNYCFRLANGGGIDHNWVRHQLEAACEANGYAQGHNYRRDISDAENNTGADGQHLEDRPNPHQPPTHEVLPRATPAAADAGAGNAVPAGLPAMAAQLLNTSALQALPDPEPLIADTIDQGTVALLYGKWGTFKSFLALDWAASVATAHPWQGRATERRRVLYVAAEGAFGFKARVASWQAGWHTTIGDDDLAILPAPVNLTNNTDVAALLELIQWGGYGFVVLDTLARCMVGGDENSAKDCGVVVDNMVRLRRATPGGRGVVLGVHHTGKDGKTFRGSSAFEAGADTVYSMTRDGGTVTLAREKRKDGPETDQHELCLDLIDGTASGVLSRFHQGGGNTDRHDRLFSTYRQHFSTTGASRADLRRVADMSDGTFYRAVNDLLKRGLLVNQGTDARPFYRAA